MSSCLYLASEYGQGAAAYTDWNGLSVGKVSRGEGEPAAFAVVLSHLERRTHALVEKVFGK